MPTGGRPGTAALRGVRVRRAGAEGIGAQSKYPQATDILLSLSYAMLEMTSGAIPETPNHTAKGHTHAQRTQLHHPSRARYRSREAVLHQQARLPGRGR